ncbi:MAG: hypothetical protein WBC06_14005 [Chitinophagaceae bacterium]
MNPAKIRLSQKEKELVTNREWILTKNHILQKAFSLLELIQVKQNQIVAASSCNQKFDEFKTTAKISKGENYQGLPYLILDFPRVFNKENIFAIRTMFWWGNFFSITLHLSGTYKSEREDSLIAAFPLLKQKKFKFCVSKDQWHHHFEKDNYLPVNNKRKNDFEMEIKQKPFIKLAKKIPLNQWDDAENLIAESFKDVIDILIL